MAIAVGRAAVESGLYDLYEIENGEMRLTGPSEKALRKRKLPPVSDYFDMQTRFKALSQESIQTLQAEVDERWVGYRERIT